MDAVETVKNTLEDLEKRSRHLTIKADQALTEAREANKKKDKRAALHALKKKKMYDAEIGKLDGEKMTLETQIFAIEGATTHTNVFNAVSVGNTALKDINKEINVEKIDQLAVEMEEQQALQQEMQEALCQPMGLMSELDEDELLRELEDMEA
mmetsp:Transcript_21214/g.9752  ORF Transcript_21214/g.9752 Transcript_21214/m.9752 type:complete len:153 (+) Transcript_21214:66-524(+)